MSDAVTLSLAHPPEHALVAQCIAADRFAALTTKDITDLPVFHGGRPARLGDFFRVAGERSSTVRTEGNLERIEGIGAGMAGGEIVIEGNAGRDVGLAMAGGRIDVRGNVGDNAGGAHPGASRGMTGGEIVIRGNAGAGPAARMRRGIVVVGGDSGRGAGVGMIAGTAVLFGKAGLGAGRFLKRGTIVALGTIDRPATFRYACTYRPPHIPLLLGYLRARYGLPVADGQIRGRYERYSGDMAETGKGEILQWVAE